MKKRLPSNIRLEHALRNIGYKNYYGYASLFEEPKHFKKGVKDWVKKIRTRIDELTQYDARLRKLVLIKLDSIDKEVSKVPDGNVEYQIIAELLYLISNLLGYDWLGEINREVD